MHVEMHELETTEEPIIFIVTPTTFPSIAAMDDFSARLGAHYTINIVESPKARHSMMLLFPKTT